MPKHGRQLFEKTCTVCHRLNDVGHSIGPELVALTDKSPQALLVAILDPNRAVEQKYVVYTAVTNQGRQYTGILAAETGSSITLLQQESKQTTILRGELEELGSAGKSLMPEGLEKDFKPQDLADIMAYVASTGPSRKTFPGQPAGDRRRLARRHAGARRDQLRNLRRHARLRAATSENSGDWHSADDRAVWTVDVPKSGLFTVSVHYSCQQRRGRQPFPVRIARPADHVPRGGDRQGLGDLLPGRDRQDPLKEGKQRFHLRAADPLKGTLAKVASVLLIPPQ